MTLVLMSLCAASSACKASDTTTGSILYYRSKVDTGRVSNADRHTLHPSLKLSLVFATILQNSLVCLWSYHHSMVFLNQFWPLGTAGHPHNTCIGTLFYTFSVHLLALSCTAEFHSLTITLVMCPPYRNAKMVPLSSKGPVCDWRDNTPL